MSRTWTNLLSPSVCRLNTSLTRLGRSAMNVSVRLSTHLFLTNRTPNPQFADNPGVHDSGTTTREFQGKRRWVRIFVFELQEPLFPFFLPFLLLVTLPSSGPPLSSKRTRLPGINTWHCVLFQ